MPEFRLTALAAAAVLASGCSPQPDQIPVSEQRRYEESMGIRAPISYEVGASWQTSRPGSFTPPGISPRQAGLSVDIGSVQRKQQPLGDKLRLMTHRGNADPNRRVLKSRLTEIRGKPALEYAEATKDVSTRKESWFSHSVEIRLDSSSVTVKIHGRIENYSQLLVQFEHTVQSLRQEEIEISI